VYPVFEGWYRDRDALFLSFGYVNLNYREVVDVQVGPDNRIEPGNIDQGQPTHFLPRRHTGIFAVRVSKDVEQRLRGEKSTVIWTITANGRTAAIPANFGPNYEINALKEPTTGNTPPVIRFVADGPVGQGPFGMRIARPAIVGQSISLDADVADDGVTKPHETARQGLVGLTWSVYRGSAPVAFAEPNPRAEGIAPGRFGHARSTVTFSSPGVYTLLLDAIDQSARDFQCCWSNGYIDFTVTAATGER
jgi:hypothetical protein